MSGISQALFAESEMNVDRFNGFCSALSFKLEDGDVCI
jgi:hypothetical protein